MLRAGYFQPYVGDNSCISSEMPHLLFLLLNHAFAN
uniref:Uncharacterized protein n=1 Tax=Arundo donax TaxID=35708 RepID=A0A0A9CZW3_ARUDO